jgi:hypothetical protein
MGTASQGGASRRFSGLFGSPERMRLGTEVALLRHATERRAQAPAKPEESARTEAIQLLLTRADDAALAGNIDDGWKHLHEARRLHIAGFTPAELLAWREALGAEARAKLTSWRGAAVQNLLALQTLEGVLEAQRQVDEHADNVYFRNRLLRRQMSVTSGGLIVALLALIPQLEFLATGALENDAALTPAAIGIAMTFGAIGACLSALIGFSGISTDQRIPERTANVLITLTRPLIGAASGLAGLLALHSNLVNLPGAGVGWLIPFVFGFSERIVLSVVEPSSSKPAKA